MIFSYPTQRELIDIAAENVARLTPTRVGLSVMPIRTVGAHFIQFNQMDNYFGLQQIRGLDGAPPSVARVGEKSYVYEPGVYGEFETLTEAELTSRAGSVTGEFSIDVGDEIVKMTNQLVARELDRAEQIVWGLLTTGTISVSTAGGSVGFKATFSLQTQDAAVNWGTAASATPLADFRAVALKGRGKGVNFGRGARAFMNRVTANKLLANTNAADLGGKRVVNGASVLSITEINRLMIEQDTPEVVIYDEGYYSAASTWTPFIPNDVVVVVGARVDGSTIGEYRMTRNANNPGFAPGSYTLVKDLTGNNPVTGLQEVPPRIEVHRGHNGGPVIYFPSAICILDTTATT